MTTLTDEQKVLLLKAAWDGVLDPGEALAIEVGRIVAGVVAEVEQERDQLRRWRAEAMPVLAGLQHLGRALGLPLGEVITGPRAAAVATTLRAELDAAQASAEDAKARAARFAQRIANIAAEQDDARLAVARVRALVEEAERGEAIIITPGFTTYHVVEVGLLRSAIDGARA